MLIPVQGTVFNLLEVQWEENSHRDNGERSEFLLSVLNDYGELKAKAASRWRLFVLLQIYLPAQSIFTIAIFSRVLFAICRAGRSPRSHLARFLVSPACDGGRDEGSATFLEKIDGSLRLGGEHL